MTLDQTLHVYTPCSRRWDMEREWDLIQKYGTWYMVPNAERYVECICGAAWRTHQ